MCAMYEVITPGTPVSGLKGVGEKTAEKLHELEIRDVNDVVFHLPTSYVDQSVVDLREAEHDSSITVEGTVKTEPKLAFFRRGMSRLTCFMDIDGIYTKVVFFNQPYLKDKLIIDEFARVYGKFDRNKLEINGQRLIFDTSPGYSVKYSLNRVMHAKTFSKLVAEVFDSHHFNHDLPEALKSKYQLWTLRDALYELHFPKSRDRLHDARRTVKFYELYQFQLKLMHKRSEERVRNDHYIINYDVERLKRFIGTLPFELTGDQKAGVNDICRDFKQNISMHRLLQGDVGSGKTIVAGICVYAVKTIGEQSVVMVPTEVLANQHYESFKDTFKDELTIERLTGSTSRKEKDRILEGLRLGEIDLLIATHAVLEDDVAFNRLSFIIIDEQHRFGVRQRQKLQAKSYRKNILYMTATPIPRTLSITTFGDMDVSIIREMPKGRKPVETSWHTFDEMDQVMAAVRAQLNEGYSTYVVAPLIEESETLDLKNVNEIYQAFIDHFGDETVELVHGRMKPEEKNHGMHLFETLEKKILISTTVIEVGINVPNATMMVIFNAERFGLSTLHQLRGRVGRSSRQSYCMLVSQPQTDNAKLRMEIMTSTSDGFELSERDLEMRGPGDYFGVRQSGLPQFKVADLIEDYRMLEYARKEAISVFEHMEDSR
ncbi:ATP-dependent DNA helicase RecG [Salinicoccus halitifaciens]|uniref:ATP-dependent DNA helicase RecG n=1 Tax=Salinicoccus halitifaciens TaxID=1073415 RepID=A0ABV2E7B1_9STAP|nr:ATP-dependent DNA helicase RecG [Salinicoccus halitifaciens]MCD2136626.1 ATP-dependent DNA helicase RecG [Salinicoccus halitifaciens]